MHIRAIDPTSPFVEESSTIVLQYAHVLSHFSCAACPVSITLLLSTSLGIISSISALYYPGMVEMDLNYSVPAHHIVDLPGLAPFSIVEHATFFKTAAGCVVVWYLVRLAIGLARPAWCESLNHNATKRAFVIGSVIGLAFKFLTIPACIAAAYMTPAEDDLAGIHPTMNVYQQVCWGSRGAVNVMELMYFIHIPELTLHHMLILVGMYAIGKFHAPHRGFDMALAALISEIPTYIFLIGKDLGIMERHPRWNRALHVAAAVTGFGFRAPATILAICMIPGTGLRGGPAVLALVGFLYYLAYVLNITWRRLKRVSVWCVLGDGDFHLQLTDRIIVSSPSVYTGLWASGSQVLIIFLASCLPFADESGLIIVTWVCLPLVLYFAWVALVACPELFDGGWKERLPATAHQLAGRVKMPRLSVLGRWVLWFWLLGVFVVARSGEVPEEQNRNVAAADILARQPPICDVVLSWHFWVCITSGWLVATAFAHVLLPSRPKDIEHSARVAEASKKDKEKESNELTPTAKERRASDLFVE